MEKEEERHADGLLPYCLHLDGVVGQDYDFLYQAGAVAIFGPGTRITTAALQVLDKIKEKRQQQQQGGSKQ